MDPSVHARYLDYLELREYFARGGNRPKLDAETFTTYDAELRSLLARERRGEAEPDEVQRIVALRKLLFRD